MSRDESDPLFSRAVPRCEFASEHPVDPVANRCKSDATLRYEFRAGTPACFCDRHALPARIAIRIQSIVTGEYLK